MEVRIVEDHREELLRALDAQTAAGLMACGMQAERFAKAECPVRTGRLRNSITHAVNGKDAVIGTNVEYAPYVENGARGRQPKHFLKHAAENHAMLYKNILTMYLKGEA